MSLLDLIEQHAGPMALQQIGARVGLSPDQIQSAITSLAPTLGAKLDQHAQAGSLPTLPSQTAPVPGSDQAAEHGTSVLSSIFGSNDESGQMATQVENQTGISSDKIKAVLPQLAGIAAAAFAMHKVSRSGAFGGVD